MNGGHYIFNGPGHIKKNPSRKNSGFRKFFLEKNQTPIEEFTQSAWSRKEWFLLSREKFRAATGSSIKPLSFPKSLRL